MIVGQKSAITCLFFMGLLLGTAAVSTAGDHYVSPTGTASWQECVSSSKPCSILTVNENITGGDTAIFLPGLYELGPKPASGCSDDSIRPCNGTGSDNYRIEFKANPGVIVKSDSTNNRVAETLGKSYISFDGFVFEHTQQAWADNTSGAGPLINFNGDYNIVQNCEFVGTGWQQVTNSPAIYVSSGSYSSTIRNNYIHGYVQPTQSDNTDGIMLYGAKNLVIENNTFENNNYHIYIKKKDDGLVIRNNFFINSIGCLLVHKKGGDPTNYQRNHQIYNNISVDNNIFMTSSDDGTGVGPLSDFKIYNNTIYNCSLGAIAWDTTPEPVNMQYWNNIITHSEKAVLVNGVTYGDYNCFYQNKYVANRLPCESITSLGAWQACSSLDFHSIESDPNFVRIGGTIPTDYKRISYPTNGRGEGFASVMGAYITGNEVVGVGVSSLNIKDITIPKR